MLEPSPKFWKAGRRYHFLKESFLLHKKGEMGTQRYPPVRQVTISPDSTMAFILKHFTCKIAALGESAVPMSPERELMWLNSGPVNS